MIQLIVKVNPRAKCEEVVFNKINETFGKPFMSQLEQLSDFFLILDFTPENVEKVTSIQDFDGILDIQLYPTNVVVSNLEKASEGEDYYIIYVQTECGKREETMKSLIASDKFKIRNAGYFFGSEADIIIEVLSAESITNVIDAIRSIESVEDTVFYTLPHTYN